MSRIVMKFGGTSVADLDRIRHVAARVKCEVEAGNEVGESDELHGEPVGIEEQICAERKLRAHLKYRRNGG